MPKYRVFIPEQTFDIEADDEYDALMLVDIDEVLENADVEEIEE